MVRVHYAQGAQRPTPTQSTCLYYCHDNEASKCVPQVHGIRDERLARIRAPHHVDLGAVQVAERRQREDGAHAVTEPSGDDGVVDPACAACAYANKQE